MYKSGLGARAALADALLRKGTSPVFLTADALRMNELAGLLSLFSRPDDWVRLPSRPTGDGGRGWGRIWASLFELARTGSPRGVILSVDNLLPYLPPRDSFDSLHLELALGEELSSDMILDQAVDWGYERVSLVVRPGETARRGDILDLFPPGWENALRLEFFGDVLEEMRLFDPMSQRSIRGLEKAFILPASACPNLEEMGGRLAEHWNGLAAKGTISEELARYLARELEPGGSGVEPGLYFQGRSRLEDWLPRDAIFLLDFPAPLSEALEAEEREWDRKIFKMAEEADGEPDKDFAFLKKGILSLPGPAAAAIEGRPRILFEDLSLGGGKTGLDLPERSFSSFEEMSVLCREDELPEDMREFSERPWRVLVQALRRWEKTRPQTILCFRSESSRSRFLKLAAQDGVSPMLEYSVGQRGIFALVSSFSRGLELSWSRTLILGEDVLQPGKKAAPARRKKFVGLARYDDLEPDDLLVHRDYGLGRFKGLERLDLGPVGNDYLLIHYQGDDKLYLPVDRLGLVQRYKGPEETAPALDRLGGAGWVKTRERAKKAIEKIAHDLVEMYAYRRIAKGFSYGPLSEIYREFEASFGFEETMDQARAIDDVLADMERPEPMDRLVCGDVGFGKTEVAMRAAVRAAMDGRQTVLLCPTTVLAEQHFQNFRSRLKDFPVNAAMLSRFVPKAEQCEVIKAVKSGRTDILIGTHRLLSKDVEVPNLGLLVLDEEQRFGVKHKERIKKLKKNIDVLTLTATPIPRTLQLSLSGLRGLSVIETPPGERKPVETAIVERDSGLLASAVARELERGGQVFWVHNRVRGLDQVEEFVRKLAPSARIGRAHGQMSERRLEEAMHDFWRGDTDILVCTAIIESGLDFPQANTLIVDQAQMFGLGQLYQLRGRVGRSDRQAYSYFVIPNAAKIPEKARKRLKTILEMDYLGAGFQVAMEDLRLRGAGNILGESQSGHIAKVGLDLYLQMLEDEVGRLRGNPVREETDPELSIGFPANIPESYISDPKERLKYYKGFTTLRDPGARNELLDEVRDRFGPAPQELVDFLSVICFKRILGRLRVARAELGLEKIKLIWDEKRGGVDPQRIVNWVVERSSRARLVPPAGLDYNFKEQAPIGALLEKAGQDLAVLLDNPDPGESVPAGA